MQTFRERERGVREAVVGYEAGDVVKGFRVQLVVVHFRKLLYAIVQIS